MPKECNLLGTVGTVGTALLTGPPGVGAPLEGWRTSTKS